VDGRIDLHELSCAHFDMMRPGPAELIAHTLVNVFNFA